MKENYYLFNLRKRARLLRWLVFLTLAICHSDLFAQREFNIFFNSNDFETTLTDGKVSLSTTKPFAGYSGDTSKPAFPLFPYCILIPEDSTSLKYNVSFESSLVHSNVDVEKNEPVMTTNGEIVGSIQDTIISVTTPAWGARVISFGKYKYICLSTTPFLYDAANKNLYFVSHIKITVPSYPSTAGTSDIIDWPLKYRDIAESLANPEDLDDFYTITNEENNRYTLQPLDYLIITSSKLASSFQNLADWKRRKGYRTEIVTTDSIYNYYSGTDEQEKIKDFLYSNLDRGIKYVLLGGDDTVVPTRTCITLGYHFPADIYYSCFSDYNNGDWDKNNDGIYGQMQDSINYFQSYFLSRLPIRTTNQVTDYTTKLQQYEMATDTTATNRILLTGFCLDNTHDSAKNYNNYLYQHYIQPFWSGNMFYMYENEGSLPDNTSYSISNIHLFNEINRGYNIIHEVSHGDTCLWVLNNQNNTFLNYKNVHASSQTNSIPSIIVTNACLTNAFNEEPCLSEAFIRNPNGGAVAYFGSSIEGFSQGTSFNGSFLYNGYFFQYLYQGKPYNAPYSFGGVVKQAKQKMLDYFDDFVFNRLLQMSINPIGDPELSIFTDKPQSFVNMNGFSVNQPAILINPIQKKITVQSTVGGCRIVLLEDNGNIQVYDSVQNATFNTHFGQHKVTILKHNYTPFLADATLDSIPNIPGPFTMNIRKDGNNYVITALKTITEDGYYYSDGESGEELEEWNLRIVNIMTGETKVNTFVQSSSYVCDASSWENGVYAVQGRDEENTAQKKIFINK